jgi:hypothetical protein
MKLRNIGIDPAHFPQKTTTLRRKFMKARRSGAARNGRNKPRDCLNTGSAFVTALTELDR